MMSGGTYHFCIFGFVVKMNEAAIGTERGGDACGCDLGSFGNC
jgi:hypothetical protein